MGNLNRVAIILSRAFLFLIFLYAGIDKLLHYSGFVRALQSYVILPSTMAPYVAVSIILAEISVALGLSVRAWHRNAAQVAMGLLLLFTVALAINNWVNPEAICGCWFTVTLSQSTEQHILQNLLMAGVAASIGITKVEGTESGAR